MRSVPLDPARMDADELAEWRWKATCPSTQAIFPITKGDVRALIERGDKALRQRDTYRGLGAEYRRQRDAARRLEAAVRAACEHDRDCDEEGEGACCYRAWRRVVLLAGCAEIVNDEDRELVAQ